MTDESIGQVPAQPSADLTPMPNVLVSYTTRELFERVDAKLDSIVRSLEDKATRKDVTDLEGDITRLHERVSALEDERDAANVLAIAHKATINRLWLIITAILVPVAVGLMLVFIH